MPNENRLELSAYRLNKAKECLENAKELLALGGYANCANRSYYAIFHSIRAILALDGLDFKKHSAVIGKFNELYVKEHVFDAIYSKIVKDAFIIRAKSDYDDFYLLDKEEVAQQLANATQFVDAVSKFLDTKK